MIAKNKANELTFRQKEIYDFIVNWKSKYNEAPTLTEIGAGVGMNKNAVREHLKRIGKKGYIKVIGFIPRGIEVIK
jgi:SOS-response transcriptional repressor LexA